MSQNTNSRAKLLILVLSVSFIVWWIYINVVLRDSNHTNANNQIFSATYGILSLVGSVIGLAASKKWGGHRSLIGRALMFFAIGLFAQEFGQVAYSVYVYALKVEIPYPSVGDVGYFSSVLFYIYAVWQLAKAAGYKFSLKDRMKKVIAVIIPLVMLSGSYFYFLRGYEFDFSSLKAGLTVLLDFGYPLGQAVYVAIALMTYLLSKKLLGGVMKNKVLLVLFALFIQYIADSSYLYAAKAAKAFPGGANDLMYLISYAVMALALTSFLSGLGTPTKPQDPKDSDTVVESDETPVLAEATESEVV